MMKFGIFMAPFHRVGENPTLCFERDMQLIESLDELGFEEAFIGEHHSSGWEIISSPEIFIAATSSSDKFKNSVVSDGCFAHQHRGKVALRFSLAALPDSTAFRALCAR